MTKRVVIVGAGPAGCAAAYDLVQAGHEALLLDWKSFPRLKPCAGALTIKAVNRLRYSVEPVVRYVARDLSVSLNGYRRRLFKGPAPICAMTVREEFDDFCLRQTMLAGAGFENIAEIELVAERDDGVSLTTSDGKVFDADFLIGADGANSQVRRLTKSFPGHQRAVALEGRVRYEDCQSAAVMQFDFGRVKGGYGWLFPKHDHINVGLYSQAAGVRFNKADLVAYCRDMLGSEKVTDMVGYPIGIGGEGYRPVGNRILLVGDAAGFTDPLLGEGIHNAIKSGQAAAGALDHIISAGGSLPQAYREKLKEVQLDLRSCRSSANWFYGLLIIGYGVLVSPPARTALMRGFAAGMTFREILGSFLSAPEYEISPVRALERFKPN